MKTYKLVNQQTGDVDFIGTYDECLVVRTQFIKKIGGILSSPEDYFKIEASEQYSAFISKIKVN